MYDGDDGVSNGYSNSAQAWIFEHAVRTGMNHEMSKEDHDMQRIMGMGGGLIWGSTINRLRIHATSQTGTSGQIHPIEKDH
jgi:hypothetical protein